jgi:tetratricopeptide (TPR) repeat protein
MRWYGVFVVSVLAAFILWSADVGTTAEALSRHRALGQAFYENPTTQQQAVTEFQEALKLAPGSPRERLNYGLALIRAGKQEEGVTELKAVQKADPKIPHTWFNLGIYYKKAGDAAEAIRQFEQMAKLTPSESIVHYQLGTLYRAEGRAPEALEQLELTERLNPRLAAAHFQLYNLYRQAGRTDEAARELDTFQRLKKEAEGSVTPEDVDWSVYAEIYDAPAVRAGPVAASPTEGKVEIDATGTGEVDVLKWSDGKIALYRRGRELVKDSGLAGISGVIFAAPGDFNNDGLMDLIILTEAGPLLYRNTGGRFAPVAADLPKRRFERAVWIDYDHDYDLDLILLGDSAVLLRNQGAAGFADRTSDFPFVKGIAKEAVKMRVDPDGKAFDLAVTYADREPVLYRDQLGGRYTAETVPKAKTDSAAARSGQHWIRIRLQGIKSLKLAQDAVVEVKAGDLYRRQFYNGVPLRFDIGANTTVDTVRITWPNGLIQNEVKQAANRTYTYVEAQRLSGSCPMIWTWNGRRVEFITDVLGVAPLGASDGEGTYFPVDHDEYVSIPGRALAPVNGRYDIRVTEELSEVSYLDQIQLTAVDHPTDIEIFTNEKFQGPPYPEFHLYAVKRRVYPSSARDDDGRDVRERLLVGDQRYPDQFPRTPLGVAPLHTLELDFAGAAADGRATLLLNGWVDWPDGSTFRAAAQERKGGLVLPYLQMQDSHRRWVTIDEDMGMPAGKPKTIAVPLRFLSASRKLRIVTSLCVYWDEIFLSEGASEPEARMQEVPLLSADLHFRGFSETRIHAERKQPDTFLYDRVSPWSFWNPTAGLYTRYGDVKPLLGDIDDRLVIMGSGDELRLQFSAATLPPLPAGWTRDFLLKVDGWAKDRDPNTAFSNNVEPLPFHGMSRYPYPANEHFPDDEAHARYRREYNTRPALRLVRPLGGSL